MTSRGMVPLIVLLVLLAVVVSVHAFHGVATYHHHHHRYHHHDATTTTTTHHTLTNSPPSSPQNQQQQQHHSLLSLYYSTSNVNNDDEDDHPQQQQQKQQLPNDSDDNDDTDNHRHHSNMNEYRSIEFFDSSIESSDFPAVLRNATSTTVTSSSSISSISSSSISTVRQQRIQREYDSRQQFVPYSNALWELREKCQLLQDEIQQYHTQIQQQQQQQSQQQQQQSSSVSNRQRPSSSSSPPKKDVDVTVVIRPFLQHRLTTLETKLHTLQQQDPEHVYQTSVQELQMIREKQHQLLQYQHQQQLDRSSSKSSSSSSSRSSIISPRQITAQLQHCTQLYDTVSTRMESAKSCLPQFNYHGLWIGKYGSGGGGNNNNNINNNNDYDLINVTYAGSMLIATKVTSQYGNIPVDEITFQVPLHPIMSQQQDTTAPSSSASSPSSPLSSIPLTPNAAQKWGISKLSRYYGYGQVAESNYINHHWVHGQFILINENYFSFAWLPPPPLSSTTTSSSGNTATKQGEMEQPDIQQTQIFFGRPSPELVLKLLSKKNVANSGSHESPAVATTSVSPNDDEPYEFPSISNRRTNQQQQQQQATQSVSSNTNDNNNNLQHQREYASRCLDLTYEHILDEIDMQHHNPYGNGIWHTNHNNNNNNNNQKQHNTGNFEGDNEECYFE